MNNLAIKIYRKICKLFEIHLSSYPYVSGDTFRKLGDHVIESAKQYDVGKIKEKDIVFVKSEFLDFFFSDIFPKISCSIILISHNSDKNITSEYSIFLNEKILHWYAQNTCFSHEKLISIPIGLENLNYFTNGLLKYFKNGNQNLPQKNCILVAFNVNTNLKTRKPCLDFFQNYKWTTMAKSFFNSTEYIKILSSHKFVASPEGNGIDCHRTWEAMYLGVIPIVKRNVFIESFSDLPIWIVEDWSELAAYDDEMLGAKYLELRKDYCEKLYFPHYEKMILSDQSSKLK